MTYTVLMGTLNPTHSITGSFVPILVYAHSSQWQMTEQGIEDREENNTSSFTEVTSTACVWCVVHVGEQSNKHCCLLVTHLLVAMVLRVGFTAIPLSLMRISTTWSYSAFQMYVCLLSLLSCCQLVWRIDYGTLYDCSSHSSLMNFVC